MRRWICIVTLLAGFTRTDYVWSARVPRPVPIERLLIDPDDTSRDRRAHGLPTMAWWVRT